MTMENTNIAENKVVEEQEIFEKLKDALNYNYLYDSWYFGDDPKEVDNLEDYLRIIKQERALEKDFNDATVAELQTYKEFIHYLATGAVGNTEYIIQEFNNCTDVDFMGYKEVTVEEVDDELYVCFKIGKDTYKARWQEEDNYAVWQTCRYEDDYSGYMLFPTKKSDTYFCLYYMC